jgi:hypothetical protein
LRFFSTFGFKGVTKTGSCNDWAQFQSSLLELTADNVVITKLSVTTVKFDQDSDGKVISNVSKSCGVDSEDVVKPFVSQLAYKGKSSMTCVDSATHWVNNWYISPCLSDSSSTSGSSSLLLGINTANQGVCEASTCPASSGGMLINPCLASCHARVTYFSYAFVKFSYQILYPQLTGLIVTSAGANTVTVTFNVSKAGTVYCAAFSPSFVVQSTLQIKATASSLRTGNYFVGHSAVTSAHIAMGSLQALTSYAVYCYTEDFSAHTMPLNASLSTRMITTTGCCKRVLFSTFPTVVFDNRTTPSKVFTFALDSAPVVGSTVTATIFVKRSNSSSQHSQSCSSDSLLPAAAKAYPSSFKFSAGSLSFQASFQVSGNPGCYVVSISAQSTSSANTYSGISAALLVLDSNLPPLPPTFTSARFTSDGLGLLLTFGAATNRGEHTITGYNSAFSCDQLFAFAGAASSRCVWVADSASSGASSSATVLATSLSTTLSVNSSRVTLLGKKLKADGCTSCSQYAAAVTLIVQGPIQVAAPVVSLVVPAKISSCDDLTFDPTSSTGNANRPWVGFMWTLTTITSDPVADGHLTRYLQAVTAEGGNLTNTQIVIPNSYIKAYTKISVTLTLVNFLGASSSVASSVTLDPSVLVPRLTIAQRGRISMTTSQPLSLFAQTVFPTCSNGLSSSGGGAFKLQYQWTFMDGTGFVLFDPKYYLHLNDQRNFKLDSYTLAPLASYMVEVAIYTEDAQKLGNPSLSTARAYIDVTQAGIRALLTAASVVSVQSGCLVDGSGSVDLDVQYGYQQKLTYSWSCVMDQTSSFGSFGSGCAAVGISGLLVGSISNTSSVLRIAANTVSLGSNTSAAVALAFTVHVKNSFGTADSATATVTFVQVPVPVLSIVSSGTTVKYNPGDKISVLGIIGPRSGFSVFASWACDKFDDISLQLVSTTQTSKTFQASAPSAVNGDNYYISLQSNSLVSGATYTFTLSASIMSGSVSSAASTASLSILINAPPSSGGFTVRPSVGTSLNSSFSLGASGWTDDADDFPLVFVFAAHASCYLFSTRTLPDGTATLVTMITSSSVPGTVIKNADTSSFLPGVWLIPGRSEYNYTVAVVAYVSDNLGSVANASASVVVYPTFYQSLSASSGVQAVQEIGALASAALDVALLTEDATSVSLVISSVMAHLTVVPCPTAEYCDIVLHRQPCSTVPNTCSTCLPGYVSGVLGGGNVTCSPIEPVLRRRLLEISVSAAVSVGIVGDQCTQPADCLSGICVSNVCKAANKPCPNGCSSNGTCVYFNTYGNQISGCPSTDSFCSSMCLCYKGAFGTDCSLNVDELISRQKLLDVLCGYLAESVYFQDVSSDVVEGRMNSLSSLLRDPSQLSVSAIENCSYTLVSTIVESSELAGHPSRAQQVADTVSLLLGYIQYAQMNNGSSVQLANTATRALEILAQGMQAWLVDDENGATVTSTNVRIYAAVWSTTSFLTASRIPGANSLNVSIPRTSLEIVEEVITPQLQFVPPTSSISLSLSPSPSTAIILMELNSNPHNYSTDSSVLGISVVGLFGAEDPTGIGIALSSLQTMVTFTNTESVHYFNESIDGNLTAYCEWSLTPYSQIFRCPDGVNWVNLSCSGLAGRFEFSCPTTYQSKPSYVYVEENGTAFTSDPTCKTISFGESETTCMCSTVSIAGIHAAGGSNARRRLSSSTATTFEYVASTSEIVTNAFGPGVVLIPFIIHVRHNNETVLGLCVFLIVALMVGFGAFAQVDYREQLCHEDTQLTARKQHRIRILSSKAFLNSILPVEFSGQRWFNILHHSLFTDHPWLTICCVKPSSKTDGAEGAFSRTMSWIIVIGKCLNVSVIVTILAMIYFPDDGRCERRLNEDSCGDVRALDWMSSMCVWSELHRVCEFNDRTGDQPLQTLILVTVVAILCFPLDNLLKFLVSVAEYFFVHRSAAIEKQSARVSLRSKRSVFWTDDVCTSLGDSQTLQSTLCRAASLKQMTQYIDDADTGSEAELLLQQCKIVRQMSMPQSDSAVQIGTDKVIAGNPPATNNSSTSQLRMTHVSASFDMVALQSLVPQQKMLAVVDTCLESRLQNTKTRQNYMAFRNALKSCLHTLRLEVSTLARDMELFESDIDRERYLLKQFLLCSIGDERARNIARRMFFNAGRRFEDSVVLHPWFGTARSCACILGLVSYLLCAFAFILLAGVRFVGARASTNWLRGIGVTLLIHVCLYEPLKCWLHRVLKPHLLGARWEGDYSAKQVQFMLTLLRERSERLLSRTHSLMRNVHATIQHSNAACRLARMYPQLPSARLLMSLTDFDLPVQLLIGRYRQEQLSSCTHWTLTFVKIVMFPFLALAFLSARFCPLIILDDVMDVSALLGLHGVLIGLCLLSTRVQWYGILIVLISAFVSWYIFEHVTHASRRKIQSRAMLPVLYGSIEEEYVYCDDHGDPCVAKEMDGLSEVPVVLISSAADSVQRPIRLKLEYRRNWFAVRDRGFVVHGKPDWVTGMELLDMHSQTVSKAKPSRLAVAHSSRSRIVTGDHDAVLASESSPRSKPIQSLAAAGAFAPSRHALNTYLTLESGATLKEDEFDLLGYAEEENPINLLESFVNSRLVGSIDSAASFAGSGQALKAAPSKYAWHAQTSNVGAQAAESSVRDNGVSIFDGDAFLFSLGINDGIRPHFHHIVQTPSAAEVASAVGLSRDFSNTRLGAHNSLKPVNAVGTSNVSSSSSRQAFNADGIPGVVGDALADSFIVGSALEELPDDSAELASRYFSINSLNGPTSTDRWPFYQADSYLLEEHEGTNRKTVELLPSDSVDSRTLFSRAPYLSSVHASLVDGDCVMPDASNCVIGSLFQDIEDKSVFDPADDVYHLV